MLVASRAAELAFSAPAARSTCGGAARSARAPLSRPRESSRSFETLSAVQRPPPHTDAYTAAAAAAASRQAPAPPTTGCCSALQVVREHYLRDDIYSGSPLDPDCPPDACKLSGEAPHYLIVDTNVALHQVCVLAAAAASACLLPLLMPLMYGGPAAAIPSPCGCSSIPSLSAAVHGCTWLQFLHLSCCHLRLGCAQMDFLEHAAVTDVIVTSVVLEEVKARNAAAYQRLRQLIAAEPKRFYVFANEHHR